MNFRSNKYFRSQSSVKEPVPARKMAESKLIDKNRESLLQKIVQTKAKVNTIQIQHKGRPMNKTVPNTPIINTECRNQYDQRTIPDHTSSVSQRHSSYFEKSDQKNLIKHEKAKRLVEDEELNQLEDNEQNLKFQIDIQVSPKKLLIVKIYKGDKAEDILMNLKRHKTLALDDEKFQRIEKVIRHHVEMY